ncbi:MAG: membrane fusion protein LapC [Rhodospirillaceae bacterium]|nr:MAG: membrane fusion protein LapC [Rhodospirillaceae bacterium]
MNAVNATTPSPPPVGFGSHLTFMLCVLAVVAFWVWAASSPLDIISMASGEVVPAGQVKIIQHLEGGIVHEILVREGSRVTAGQSLVILEPTFGYPRADRRRCRCGRNQGAHGNA